MKTKNFFKKYYMYGYLISYMCISKILKYLVITSNVVYIVFLVFTIKVIFNLLWLCHTLKLEIPATRWMMCEVSLLVIVVTK